MLSQLGITLPPGTPMLQLKNVAAVMVTATLPAFARPGQPIDVTVSSLGNAKSLRGGTLLLTPLKGADGQVYALAQGNVLVGGVGASSAGTSVTVNHLSVGRISGGRDGRARGAEHCSRRTGTSTLAVNSTDFTTTERIVSAINSAFGDGVAIAIDGRTVQVGAPEDPAQRVAFLARVESLDVTPGAAAAKVIVNARTGSVVMNQTVTVETCAVAHGNLSVVISTEPVISQPSPFARRGDTVVAENARDRDPRRESRAHDGARRGPERGREGAQRGRSHAPGSALHPPGHESRRRAARGAGDHLRAHPWP